MSKKTFNIVTLPGDGIGPDIVGEAVKVMKRIGEIYGYAEIITRCTKYCYILIMSRWIHSHI